MTNNSNQSLEKDENRAAKKAEILNMPGKGKIVPLLIAISIVTILATAIIVWNRWGGTLAATQADRVSEFTYLLADFADGKAKYYSYKTEDGVDIRFFVLKSSDGVARAAFDACDVCWRSGLGYAQEGDEMVCRNCGRRFASNRINEVRGGCNPAPLNRRVEGDKLVISAGDIVTGRGFFDFKS